MNVNQMNIFLNSRVGKRLIKQAEAEEKVFQDHLQLQATKIAEAKESYDFMFNGTASNTERIMEFDGALLYVTTGDRSRITSAKPITNESFKELPIEMVAHLKANHPVVTLKLQHGQYNDKLTERAFELMEATERYPYDVVQALASAPQSDDRNKPHYNVDAWKHYSTTENRTDGISKRAEELLNAFSESNLIDVNRRILAMEDDFETVKEGGTIKDFVDHFADNSGGEPA
ncbi:hypothetical protein [Bacillus mycoides]|uniref:Uncharacterized protein n=1 Tax=Bacillus mycoides TaxID=1405 RepID=A0A1G4EHI9_BACMY|nr:hypothetical protein [Bacillus mycoides]SCB67374.1 Uncharacterized protein BWGO95_01497 [Bacillus mycoides]